MTWVNKKGFVNYFGNKIHKHSKNLLTTQKFNLENIYETNV